MLGSPIHSLTVLPNNFVIAGLENGQMAIWDLNKNSVTSIPAHQAAITSLFSNAQVVISGDCQGNIVVRDAGTADVILQSPPIQQG